MFIKTWNFTRPIDTAWASNDDMSNADWIVLKFLRPVDGRGKIHSNDCLLRVYKKWDKEWGRKNACWQISCLEWGLCDHMMTFKLVWEAAVLIIYICLLIVYKNVECCTDTCRLLLVIKRERHFLEWCVLSLIDMEMFWATFRRIYWCLTCGRLWFIWVLICDASW